MEIKENCIQLKIDTIISDVNKNNESPQNEEKNQITALIGYSHCIDLFEFLKLYSKPQKNELLFQTAIIYDSIGYSELSMEYINEALLIIPNVPTIILYKSGLYANQNKLDEAQKWLLKYKYLIGENRYDNYIYESFQTIFYFLLEYEEFIILRNINSMEEKYSNYLKENFIIYYIKSQILEKLAQKIKNADNKRYISYLKESNKIKKTYLQSKKAEIEFIKEQGIKPENFTKLLIFIAPQCLSYRPKKLDEYKNNFIKSGFQLFYTLIKINKILKFKIELKKYKKIYNEKNTENIATNNINDILKNILKNSNDDESNDISMKSCKSNIMTLYNSIWLKSFLNRNNSLQKIEIKPIDTKALNINYYTKEGYYSHLNLDDNIIKYIKYNNDYKQNNLKDDLFLDVITSGKEQESLLNSDNEDKIENDNDINTNSNKTNMISKSKTNNNSNVDLIKISQKETKRTNNENDVKSKKFCSTDNYNNQIFSKNTSTNINNNINNQIQANTIKIESKVVVVKKKNKDDDDNSDNNKKEKDKDKDSIRLSDEKERNKEKKFEFIKKGEKNINKTEKNSGLFEKNNLNNNFFIGIKKKEIKNNNNKNKLLSTSSSNKKISLINSKDKSKTINKNVHKNPIFCFGDDKKMDTDYGKYKDADEVNLVSYCLKQLMKKRETKNKKTKQKEIINLTDKMDLLAPQKILNFEKQIFQINDQKFLKSRSKKKKFLNQSLKNQVNTFNFEKKISQKNTLKNSQNNLLSTNKNSYSSNALNGNPKNLKKSGFGNSKKELSKFKSLNYLYGNFYSNNNYLNINFNNYMNYNFNYSNRHEDKKNLDFKFHQNSDKKKDDSSYSKDKFNFRTINLDFKNMSTKLNLHSKKPLLNSFIDSKDKNKKSSQKNLEFVPMPFNKIKNSPSGEMYCLKKKINNFKSNLIKQKTKTSFSKYMLYNLGKKSEALYFSKSINTSEYTKYKNSSINKSKNMKRKYNKTMNGKSTIKINNK